MSEKMDGLMNEWKEDLKLIKRMKCKNELMNKWMNKLYEFVE